MHRTKYWLLTALLTVTGTQAGDRYVIFGGGPAPDAAQVSIEKNVLWIDQVLQSFAFEHSRVIFGAGNRNTADVVLMSPNDPATRHWLPLARLYNKQQEALMQFRPNIVARNEGNFSKENVSKLLQEEISQLKTGDSLFLLYSGHGSYNGSDYSKNAFRLWGDSSLDVGEFTKLLTATPTGATVRYVLPQCFSGAFTRSILSNPAKPGIANSATNRCGFFAVSEDKIAEGCTAGIDAGDYRDYATYFVAALAGKTRLGDALTANPDLNGDGLVSLSEAHSYAYTEGLSTDIPRATSDYYLELWEPWYVRWHSFTPIAPDNSYWKMAKALAAHLHINAKSPSIMAVDALEQRRAINMAIEDEQRKHDEQHTQAEKLRNALSKRFHREWPNAMHPQSATYIQFLQTDGESALQWITSQPEYTEMALLQDSAAATTMAVLDLQRKEAQYSRLLRALRLAAIRENFERLASADERKHYTALTTCENWVPPHTAATRH